MKLMHLAIGAAAFAATACSSQNGDEGIIDRPDFKTKTGVFDIEALEALGRVTDPQVSPDGKQILYGVSYENVERNSSNRDLYVMGVDGKNPKRITQSSSSENAAVWFDGGNRIAFIYPGEEGKPQLWTMDANGGNRLQITMLENGIEGFLLSPDEKKILLIQNIKYSQTAADIYPDLPKATGRVIDDLMYKHWDEWVTEIPHPFIGDFNGTKVTNLVDIMEGEPYESPMKPFGGPESFAWSKDSKSIVYVSRKKKGIDYALSTNSDLYLYDIEKKTTENLTDGMMGYDTNPVFSPDGTKLAWLSMEHDGYEADKNRLMVRDMSTGDKIDLTEKFDNTVETFAWNPNGKSLWFIAYDQGVAPVFSVDIASRSVTDVQRGEYDYASISPVDENTVITTRHSLVRPNEIYSVSNNKATALTDVNGEIFKQIKMPEFKRKMIKTTDGKEMLTWIGYPQDFDSTKTYPAILYCQGGPQSAVSQFWSYRWNLSLMAANGYIIIAPNRRGVPGFGIEWLAQISKDYPGQNMQDYLSAVDEMKKEPYIDEKHIGATGASYGGFSVYMLAGIHNNRFAALLAHAGIFNTEAQYLETEEMWFANWDMGGAFWDKENAAAQRTFANSPHKFVDKWNTPIMISHGEHDYRILSSQGEMAFNAAKLNNIPAEMVIFPDENHWILHPQNAVLWQRLFFRWFDKWLKPQSGGSNHNDQK